ncbi:hypothetical protein M378DRAFT_170059 [Amanita muscaria Koide BX008]|uniref:Uncharacterized protein n=1 Tax=Amanita muscaria (strain Koide BX008) TaxID=946122 RepID=A0A0C2WRF7_AMAMK|nr:hypothetical protein M378DRAFT_170059 [Amanita muscaria Koide BX008]
MTLTTRIVAVVECLNACTLKGLLAYHLSSTCLRGLSQSKTRQMPLRAVLRPWVVQ